MTNEDVVIGKSYHVKYDCPFHGLEEHDVTISGPIESDGLFPSVELGTGQNGWVEASDLTELPSPKES